MDDSALIDNFWEARRQGEFFPAAGSTNLRSTRRIVFSSAWFAAVRGRRTTDRLEGGPDGEDHTGTVWI